MSAAGLAGKPKKKMDVKLNSEEMKPRDRDGRRERRRMLVTEGRTTVLWPPFVVGVQVRERAKTKTMKKNWGGEVSPTEEKGVHIYILK